jgi:hypothetical protein
VHLLDDYIGSASTLREVGQLLRKTGELDRELVPLMIARVRWKLGAPGMATRRWKISDVSGYHQTVP